MDPQAILSAERDLSYIKAKLDYYRETAAIMKNALGQVRDPNLRNLYNMVLRATDERIAALNFIYSKFDTFKTFFK